MHTGENGRTARPRRDIVVIGASAGGVEALMAIAEDLPPDLGAAVFVVLHLGEGATSFLPEILDRAGPLPATAAVDRAPIEPGTIAVAPPDHHLVVESGRVRVLHAAPKVNGRRPSVDVLFHSAARVYGSRVIGVVLSGTLSDGTLGLQAIQRRSGVAIVQPTRCTRECRRARSRRSMSTRCWPSGRSAGSLRCA